MEQLADEPNKIFAPVIIDTENVKIRPLATVTWQRLAEDLLYPGSFHATNWGIKTPEDIKSRHESWVAAPEKKRGNSIVFLSQDESVILGMTSFMNVEPEHRMIEIGGTWINKKHQRSFVNTETKFALLQYAFEILNLNRVEFRIDADNIISQQAVRRLGFGFDGRMPRRKVNANGETRDYVFYSVTDHSWPKIKNHIAHLLAKTRLPEYPAIKNVKTLMRESKNDLAFQTATSAISKFPASAELHLSCWLDL